MRPVLTFRRDASGEYAHPDKPELIIGELTLHDEDTGLHLVIPAASGLAGHQDPDNSWKRGKAWLPLSDEIVGEYRVSTTPTRSAKIGGIGFHITPDPVVFVDDPTKVRSELLIHADNGQPGTAGCIGVQHLGGMRIFGSFADIMTRYNIAGIKDMPLVVVP